ncbi:MAG: phenylalanine--tRNA ligase subunit alpha [Planctomycetota bacterium]|jgi:phenylalanyl-tRNA synthetase alpha chain
MQYKISEIQNQAKEDLANAESLDEVESLKTKYVGRKGGIINEVIKAIPGLPPEQRSTTGKSANKLKHEIEKWIEETKAKFADETRSTGSKEMFDLSLPGKHMHYGRKHPLTQTIDEIKNIFRKLCFEIEYGPEVEHEYYNFDALNIPADHPSREDFDTFYLGNKRLLRSQTSTVQIRVMEKKKPPIRMIAPGKVFRPDTVDARHASMFHQIEGLMVEEGVSFSDLKYVLTLFAQSYFGRDIKMRFRPSFFPFTEPSAEVDISCSLCKGKGCSVCSNSGWVEVLGAGMVDPNVFETVGYDSEKYSGFAFGMGVERLTMLRYGIDNIRLFFENDLRFLSQF